MTIQEIICKCDICGKEMRESETGHKHWQSYLILGSNIDLDDETDINYGDVCDDCTTAIRTVIDKRRNDKSVLTSFFEDKLREINK